MAFEIVVCIASHDSSVYNHVSPLALHPDVSKVWIVRTHPSAYAEVPKAEYALTRWKWMPLRLINLFWLLWKIGGRREVRAFASFNPIPYGTLTWLAARLRRKPVHMGFIGSDWQVHMRSGWSAIFLPLIRRADFVTTTGKTMRDEAIEAGVAANRCVVLPHGIDLGRYPVEESSDKDYDFFYAGELISLKNVDVILRAFAKVVDSSPDSRLGIAGRGPLDAQLKEQARALGIEKSVDFLGYVNPVQPHMSRAKTIVIASETEGFPFTLIEGACSGLVPISTPVGSVPDHLTDGVNSLLVPVGDVDALASAMTSLLEDRSLYLGLRREALKLRDIFSFPATTAVWDVWLRGLDQPKL